jgi:multiple sugar transport system ATP-binding protein
MVDVRLENVRKVFDTGSEPVVAVEGTNLEIAHNEFFSFVGPSGCGKTTTLRMIAGLDAPTSGEIYFDDEPVSDLAPQQRNIAMVFQNVVLYPHMSNYDNIGYSLRVRGKPDDYDEKIRETAEMLGISEILDKMPSQISGGQQQRVALGRAIVRDPNVILFDEPMSDLDAKLKADLRVQIQRLQNQIDSTMIYVTHDQEEAMTMSDRIGLMNEGHMEQVDKPKDLFDSPETQFAGQFIGQPAMNVLEGELDDSGTFTVGSYSMDLSEDLGEELASLGRVRINLGFRPSHVVLTDSAEDPLFHATVDVWEPIGTETVVYLTDENDQEIKAITSETDFIESQQKIDIAGLVKFYFFDHETGEKISEIEGRHKQIEHSVQ